jgi:hypothetical protein
VIVTQTDFVTGYSEYQTALKHTALRTSKNGVVKVLRVKQAIRENDKVGFLQVKLEIKQVCRETPFQMLAVVQITKILQTPPLI